jgi:hypothetical protein
MSRGPVSTFGASRKLKTEAAKRKDKY